jgi:hypothetical protein
MEQNRRQAIEATISAVAAAWLLPHNAAEASGDHVILTPETHAPCRVFDYFGDELSGGPCIWANATTGESRHLVPKADGTMEWYVTGDERRCAHVVETRWHPAPLRWEPMSSGATP